MNAFHVRGTWAISVPEYAGLIPQQLKKDGFEFIGSSIDVDTFLPHGHGNDHVRYLCQRTTNQQQLFLVDSKVQINDGVRITVDSPIQLDEHDFGSLSKVAQLQRQTRVLPRATKHQQIFRKKINGQEVTVFVTSEGSLAYHSGMTLYLLEIATETDSETVIPHLRSLLQDIAQLLLGSNRQCTEFSVPEMAEDTWRLVNGLTRS